MLLNAMEIGGLDGRFRLTCERVMRSLRSNRDAIVATLETFVYDPLVTWRLLVRQHTKLERFLKASAIMSGQQDLAKSGSIQIGQAPPKSLLSYSEVLSKITAHCTKCKNPASQRAPSFKQRTNRFKRRSSFRDHRHHHSHSKPSYARSSADAYPVRNMRSSPITMKGRSKLSFPSENINNSDSRHNVEDSGYESESEREDEWETNSGHHNLYPIHIFAYLLFLSFVRPYISQ